MFFLILLWIKLSNTLEDGESINFDGVKLGEEKGKWLYPVFKAGKYSLGRLNPGDLFSLERLEKLEEEKWVVSSCNSEGEAGELNRNKTW